MTNVITVYQPSASLIMAGIKPWETRAIHRTATCAPKVCAVYRARGSTQVTGSSSTRLIDRSRHRITNGRPR